MSCAMCHAVSRSITLVIVSLFCDRGRSHVLKLLVIESPHVVLDVFGSCETVQSEGGVRTRVLVYCCTAVLVGSYA